MRLTRRDLLTIGSAGALAVSLCGCRSFEQSLFPITVASDAPAGRPLLSRDSAARLCNRVGFGHRPGDRTAVQKLGLEQFVDRQLDPQSIPESFAMTGRLRSLLDQLPDDYGLLYETDDHELVDTLAQMSLLYAVYSNRGLYERMVEFWTDHFNIYVFKSLGLPQYTALFQRDVIRRHALSDFRTLLGAVAHSAAILSYLDNDDNRKGRPNENYARELLELHTLGVDGGYRQCDVEAVARCLTGWTFDQSLRPGRFFFDANDHDNGPKVILAQSTTAKGEREMDEVLDALASHPSTARHIARKLLAWFRGDGRPEHVHRVASVFLSSGGDIRKTVRAVVVDCGLLDAPPIMKRPFDYIASALRVFDADTDCRSAASEYISKMGQPLYQWPRPDGYSDKSRSWATCLSVRWQFTLDLTAGTVSNTSIDWRKLVPSQTGDDILQRVFSSSDHFFRCNPGIQNDFRRYAPEEAAAVALMSPQFQWR